MPSESCPDCEATPLAMSIADARDERFFGGHVDAKGNRHDGMAHDPDCPRVWPPRTLYVARHPDLPAPYFRPIFGQGLAAAMQLAEDGWEVVTYIRDPARDS